MRPHDISWARHSHSPVQEGSADVPLDGVMQDVAYLLRRILLLGCEYAGEWLWATSWTGLTLLLGEPKVPCK
jgi:hypothetical protein